VGLAKPALRLIAREHARKPFTGPVLTLGRQNVYATPTDVRALLRDEGLTPAADVPPDELVTSIPSLAGTGYIGDVGYFRLLGVRGDLQALDYSTFEQADVVHDLNVPVPKELRGRFDLVLDSGTMEHVFDVRQALANIVHLLKPGGRVMHISPANNFVNHGLYQFSPTLFFDYYAANGFADPRGVVFEYDPFIPTERHVWDLFALNADTGWMTSRNALAVMFVAEKTAASTADRVPLQSFYRELYGSSAAARPRVARSRLKALVPPRVKQWMAKHVPGVSRARRPWGLTPLGRIR
jgi:SAM-dependent methyltransferase